MIREYTISVETPEGVTTEDEVFNVFHAAILQDTEAHGPTASLDSRRGVIRAEFVVEADQLGTSQEIGGRIFARALEVAGLACGYEFVQSAEGPFVG